MVNKSLLLKHLILSAGLPSALSLGISLLLLHGESESSARQQEEISTLRQDLNALKTDLAQQRQGREEILSRLSQLDTQSHTQQSHLATLRSSQAALQQELHALKARNAQLTADSQTTRQNSLLPLRHLDELSGQIQQLRLDLAQLRAENDATTQYLIALQNTLLQHISSSPATSAPSDSSPDWSNKADLLKAGYKILREKGGSLLHGVQDFVDQQRADSLSFPAG